VTPLSEHEQKILDEIEKSLTGEPPSRSGSVGAPARHARRFRLGVGLAIVGFLLLIAFFVTRQVIIGVFAFGGMVVGIVIMAGAASGYVTARNASSHLSTREKLTRSFKGWEQDLRDRHRRE
jgi:hypothetical protein